MRISRIPRHRRYLALFPGLALFTTLLLVGATTSFATGCEDTADAMLLSCLHEGKDDFWSGTGICLNGTDGRCQRGVRKEQKAMKRECRAQHEARLELCDDLGEDRYDPSWDPDDFTDDFNGLNPYFPLEVGNFWVLEGGGETIAIEVLDETKYIDGVTCIVVRDLVSEDDEDLEDTDDWYGQATNGDVHYCGELSRDFVYVEGDMPLLRELFEIEGSFKAGRDGDKPGILMFSSPMTGQKYRQEWSLGNAEDVAEVLSHTYSFGSDPDLDEFAPAGLVNLLCNGDCVVTEDSSPHDPGEVEYKYYAPGIGLFLEVKPEDGEVFELVECNMDARCNML